MEEEIYDVERLKFFNKLFNRLNTILMDDKELKDFKQYKREQRYYFMGKDVNGKYHKIYFGKITSIKFK